MNPGHHISAFESAADTAPLAALHAACFAKSWDAAEITAMLAAPGVFAFHNADGFVLARAAAGEAEILTLAVAPQKRGHGLGRALLQAAILRVQELGAQSLFLEVGADNPSALALYAGLGFAKVGARKGYYVTASGSADALVLRLPLPVKFA
ncbi:MAG TPA: GNAT family N-acetyltransferase [Rhizomicrobium sp.]|nr:GNAT family N-acetyltransferase [Rhizomicrobium sp.]